LTGTSALQFKLVSRVSIIMPAVSYYKLCGSVYGCREQLPKG